MYHLDHPCAVGGGMSVCTVCETPLPENSRFCPSCGTPVPGLTPTASILDPVNELLERIKRIVAGRFEILGELGRGGMAVVLLARQVSLDRELAVKVLNPALNHDADLVQRFLREARTQGRLDHNGIIPVYEVYQEGGLSFYTMPRIQGPSLRLFLRQNPRPPIDQVRRFLRESAEALGYAHRQGLIHRDVKPENMLIDEQKNRLILTDFGIAKTLSSMTMLTLTGEQLGTPRYMSPDQGDTRRPLDGRSDQYSLGLVGYEMLAGHMALQADNLAELMYKHRFEEPEPLSLIRPDAPPGLTAAIMRAIRKNRDERFDTMEDFSRALLRDDAPTPVVAQPPPAATTVIPVAPAQAPAAPPAAQAPTPPPAAPLGATRPELAAAGRKRPAWLPLTAGLLLLGGGALLFRALTAPSGSRPAPVVAQAPPAALTPGISLDPGQIPQVEVVPAVPGPPASLQPEGPGSGAAVESHPGDEAAALAEWARRQGEFARFQRGLSVDIDSLVSAALAGRYGSLDAIEERAESLATVGRFEAAARFLGDAQLAIGREARQATRARIGVTSARADAERGRLTALQAGVREDRAPEFERLEALRHRAENLETGGRLGEAEKAFREAAKGYRAAAAMSSGTPGPGKSPAGAIPADASQAPDPSTELGGEVERFGRALATEDLARIRAEFPRLTLSRDDAELLSAIFDRTDRLTVTAKHSKVTAAGATASADADYELSFLQSRTRESGRQSVKLRLTFVRGASGWDLLKLQRR